MIRRVLVLAVAVAVAAALFVSLAPAARQATPAFPVTVGSGTTALKITRQPKRIVSLSATATESLFAIGAGAQVVAVDDQSDYPKQAPRTALSGFTPNVEAIASYKPDLVVVAYDPKDLVASLAKLEVPVLVQDAPADLAGAYAQIADLGKATGHRAEADALVSRMRKRITAIVKTTAARAAGLSVYHELTPDFYSASSSSFIGRIYTLLGLTNIADEADKTGNGYPQLSAEYIVSRSPDVIVLADTVCCGQTAATVAARPGWSGIDAVETGSTVRINDSIASRWGPRVVNFFRALSSAVARLKA